MRRRATVLLPLAAAGIVAYLLREVEMGRAREPVARRATASRADAETLASAGPEEAPVEAEAPVAGTVRDGEGRPFVGARVRLYPGGAPSGQWTDASPVHGDPASEVTTSADGRFELAARGGGPWTLAADASGHIPARRFVPAGEAAHVLVLARGGAQRLRVVDAEGAPLPAADALVFQGSESLRMTARADADGWIEFVAAPRDLVVVRAPRFTWELVECPLETPEVTLDREYRIGGVVVTGDGEPAAGVGLSFERYLWIDHVVTADDGSFLVGGLAESQADLTVTPPGREWRRVTVQPGDERLRIVVPTARVEGVVLLPDGRPASGALVDRRVLCDDQGRFALADVWPGDTVLRASVRGPGTHLEGRASLVVGGEDVKGIRITLGRAPLSFVRVSVFGPEGTPVEADVGVAGDPSAQWCRDGAGCGLLEVEIAPGTEVELSAWARAGPSPRPWCSMRAVSCASREGPVVMLHLARPQPSAPPTIITLVCRNADGSALPEGVETRAWIEELPARELASDGPGRRRFAIPFGTTDAGVIVVRARGYAPATLEDWTPPAAGGEVEIRLRPAVRIAGRVFDPEAPAADDIEFTYSDGFSWGDFGADGRFSLDAAPGKHVRIMARRGPVPGLVLCLEVPATGPMNLGDIRLERPWILRGTVADENGLAAGGATVRVTGPGYDGRAVSRGDGTFRLAAPPSDLFSVVAEKAGRESDPVPASTFLRPSQILRFR